MKTSSRLRFAASVLSLVILAIAVRSSAAPAAAEPKTKGSPAASKSRIESTPNESTPIGSVAVEPENYDKLHVGDSSGGKTVVPTNQVISPLGDQIVFPSRPVALALSPDGHWLACLCNNCILAIDLDAKSTDPKKIASTISHHGSFAGILFSPDGKTVFASSTGTAIEAYSISADGVLKKDRSISVAMPGGKPKGAIPVGIALDPGKKSIWVALNLGNYVVEIDLESGKVIREIPVGNAPFDVVPAGGKIYVSNWAGRRPEKDSVTAGAGRGGATRVDARRNIACEGSVSVVDPASGKAIKEIVVGPHASGLAASPDGRFVCVANTGVDTVSVIDVATDEVVETISTHLIPELPLGSSSNALAFDREGKTLYISNGTNNAIAVVAFEPTKSRLLGCMPTGWYPAGIVFDARRNMLDVANLKGLGTRNKASSGRLKIKGKVVWRFSALEPVGTLSLIPLPKANDFKNELAAATKTVLDNDRLSEALQLESQPRKNIEPCPVPRRHGEPSVFKHVIYIIKENRTYDQVLGDMKEGEGDPSLCIFGEKVTPNIHKLAREFVLLDNFYCNGTVSPEGHAWTDEAFANDYLEKSVTLWPRSYPYDGGDAMAYAQSGFLWDNALAHGKTFRDYGEFSLPTVRWKEPGHKRNPTFVDCYTDYLAKAGHIDIHGTPNLKTLEPYFCPTSIGFPCTVSDQYRAEQLIRELHEWERDGGMPDLIMMHLPNDHTSGTTGGLPTPAAAVADNDLAVGRIVEAVSHGKYWADTCIFIVEDDPQNGFDHIDGHRTEALVVSAYTRRRAVDSTNYNQTGMVRTIELILGLPPMNQLDATATSMANSFMTKADMTPFETVKNRVPLDQLSAETRKITDPAQRHWSEVSSRLPLDDVDEADEDTLNRILWHAMRGRDDTYPAWAVLPKPDDDD